MTAVVMVVSRFLFIALVLLYTFTVCRTSIDEKGAPVFFRGVAFVCILLFALLGFGVIYLNVGDTKTLGMGATYILGMIIFYGLYHKVYGKTCNTLISNIMMCTTISVIMILRLNQSLASRQIVFALLAMVIILVVPIFVKRLIKYNNIDVYCGIISIVFMLVLIIIGKVSYGALLSIDLGLISVQPFEVVKVLFVIYLAGALRRDSSLKGVIKCGAITGLLLGMLVIANDFGAALIIMVSFLLMTYIGSANYWYIFGGGALALILGPIAIKYVSHINERFQAWLDPFVVIEDQGYQVCQSLFSLVSGGVLGRGLYGGMPERIPVVEKDFIFTAIAEEFGVIVAVCLILLCINTFLVIMKMALKPRIKQKKRYNTFVRLILTGFGIVYIFQVFLTIGGAVKFIPSTGVTLPFVSYGGSSLMGSAFMISVIVAIGSFKMGDNSERVKQ